MVMSEREYLLHEAENLRGDHPWIPGATFRTVPGLAAFLADKIEEFANRDLTLSSDQPKARKTDPATSHDAASLMKANSTTQRIRLLHAFGKSRFGLTDAEAAFEAGLSPHSEYATRCSELRNMGVIEFTGENRASLGHAARAISVVTADGRDILLRRALRATR